MPCWIVGWLEADIRWGELARTDGAANPARTPPADFSPREETKYDDSLVRKGMRPLLYGADVLSDRVAGRGSPLSAPGAPCLWFSQEPVEPVLPSLLPFTHPPSGT